MNTTTNNATVRIYKVTCAASESIYTAQMIWANTGSEDSDRAAVTDTATRYAERHGYTLVSVDEITERKAQSLINRGMSYNPIDDQAERDHDPSFTAEDTDSAEDGSASEAEEVEAETAAIREYVAKLPEEVRYARSVARDLEAVYNGEEVDGCTDVLDYINDIYADIFSA